MIYEETGAAFAETPIGREGNIDIDGSIRLILSRNQDENDESLVSSEFFERRQRLLDRTIEDIDLFIKRAPEFEKEVDSYLVVGSYLWCH